MTSIYSADPVRTLFPEAKTLGSAAWSLALQNGRHHETSVIFQGGLVILKTSLERVLRSASQLAQISPSLPPGCRILYSLGGVWLATEIANDGAVTTAFTRAVHVFQQGLDVICGTAGMISVGYQTRVESLPEVLDVNSAWQLTEGPDGAMTARLAHKKGSLPVTVSAIGTAVEVLGPGNHPSAVREAVAEVLLRSASKVRFVRACAEETADGRWRAWLEVPQLTCSVDDSLTALALVCRDCGAEAAALGDPALANIYSGISSVWRACGPPTLEERR